MSMQDLHRIVNVARGVLLAAALWLCVDVSHARAGDTHVKLVVFGDSLTAGSQIGRESALAAKLQAKLEKMGYTNFSIEDMSVTGDSTAAAYQRVNRVAARYPDIVIVALGADDAVKNIDTAAINQYVGMAISYLTGKGIGVVLLGVDAPLSATEEYKSNLETVFANLASHYRTAFVPNILGDVLNNPKHTLADRYRPNGKGVDAMVERSHVLVAAYMDTVIRRKKAAITDSDGTFAPLPPAQPVPELK